MDADIVVPVAFFVMFAVVWVGTPIARAWARQLDRGVGRVKLPPGLSERLEHMEQALDAISIEVERISEGQRFTTRLLSERAEPVTSRATEADGARSAPLD